ncbi:MAG: hypothetical protein EZS28_024557, partial [Streblomastix strix]
MAKISGEEFMIQAMFLNQLVSVATKNDPEIELRFILRQYNKRLKMDQLKEIIEIAQENSQSATMKLIDFADSVEKYFRPQSTLNSGAICFNNIINEHIQKLQNNLFSLNQNYEQDLVNSAINYINLRIDAFLYHFWIFDSTVNFTYRMIGLIRLYCPTSNNYITTVELKKFTSTNGLSVRYLFGKQVDINPNGTFTTTDIQPVNVQQLAMQQIINNINTFPVRLICSLPALCIKEWENIYTAVGRTNYYGQFVPEVISEYYQQNNDQTVGSASGYWFANRIIVSPNLYVQLVGGQDLYDGQNENGANYLVNMSSAIKQIDLEVWFYQTKHDNESLEVDLPIFCPYIRIFLEQPQMLIICVSNQLQGITMQSVGGNGFSNVCFKQNLIDAPVLWGQNMMSQQCLVGQNKTLQFIDTVDSARTGFNRERTVNQRDETFEMFVNEIYKAQHHQAFKIQFNFGVTYEEYRHDQNDQVQIDYGYILPRDTRIQEHSPKVIQNQDVIEEYQQYIKAEIINMQNFTLYSTRQRYIAIYSMLFKTYNLQPQVVGASMKELIDLHCNGRKNVIYQNSGNNNNCYMEAIAKALHPDSKEKRYFPYEIISISKQLLVQVLELPFDSKSRKMTDLLK